MQLVGECDIRMQLGPNDERRIGGEGYEGEREREGGSAALHLISILVSSGRAASDSTPASRPAPSAPSCRFRSTRLAPPAAAAPVSVTSPSYDTCGAGWIREVRRRAEEDTMSQCGRVCAGGGACMPRV